MRRLIYSLTVLVFAIVVGGCATTKALSQTARASVDQVSISDSVAVAPTRVSDYGLIKVIHYNPHFFGGTFLTPGSGPVGDAILASGEWDENRQFAMFLKATGIDVALIVRSEFEAQIRQHPFFGPRLVQVAPYRFELEVPNYGLVQVRNFSAYHKATMVVRARLVGPTGEVLAQAKGSSCVLRECFEADTLSDIIAKPEMLRQQYMLAARNAIQELLQSL
jgi:hypothetical protein